VLPRPSLTILGPPPSCLKTAVLPLGRPGRNTDSRPAPSAALGSPPRGVGGTTQPSLFFIRTVPAGSPGRLGTLYTPANEVGFHYPAQSGNLQWEGGMGAIRTLLSEQPLIVIVGSGRAASRIRKHAGVFQ